MSKAERGPGCSAGNKDGKVEKVNRTVMRSEGNPWLISFTLMQPNEEPVLVPVSTILEAPENKNIYQVITLDDAEMVTLCKSIQQYGIKTPIRVSRDGYILSGHRRFFAAKALRLEHVPVVVDKVCRTHNPEEFVKLLVELNAQRIKDAHTQLKESLIQIDPKKAHQQIVNERVEKAIREIGLEKIEPKNLGRRHKISAAKDKFLEAILNILEQHRARWPLTDRQIHYRLLGPHAPLIHGSKPDSRYTNEKNSYTRLTDLLTRGRIEGLIPWQAIDDPTRPVNLNKAFDNPADFFRCELDDFLVGYWRNRLQTQPNHIEIVAEKLTVQRLVEKVAQEYTMPVTIIRGQSAIIRKYDILQRFKRSKKERLILLAVSDLDPAGDAIAEDVRKSIERDFGITKVDVYKVALTSDQVAEYELPPSMEAKEKSPTYDKFVSKYDSNLAYELEALDPEDLDAILDDAIIEVLDLERYNEQLEAEEKDSTEIVAVRQQAEAFFKSLRPLR